MKRRRHLASLPEKKRHEARIALKKSRYAAEFFESLFDSRARKYMRAAAKIQDSLGAFNDLAMAARLLHEIDEAHNQPTPASQFVADRLMQARDKMTADWKSTERMLKRLEPFWN